MTAYVMAQINIHDRSRYAEYEAGFMAVFAQYEGTMLSVDEAPEVLEGLWPYTRTVLIGFPSPQHAKDWFMSAQYQELAKHRHAAAESHCVIVSGLAS
ncbi:MAG: DUF1330 domain-containing protein [Proteobacteria bacterium]|nr:DUF1330 domain-containing protein [Pseudomonadota bacterium]